MKNSFENLFGELTDEEIRRFREVVSAPAEKVYRKDEMELWPKDDGDDDLILEYLSRERNNE